MLTKLSALSFGTFLTAALLFAANPWDKPYTEWTEEVRQRVAEDSPWGDKRDRETGQISNENAQIKAKGVRMMWESALPIKHVLLGKAAQTDPAAKARIDREEPYHVLHIENLPGTLRELVSEKEKIIASTAIKVKGKPDIHPIDIQQPAAAAAPKGGFGGAFGKAGAKGGAAPAPAGSDEDFGSLEAGGAAPTGGGGGMPGGRGGMGRGGMGMGAGMGGPSIQLYFVFAKDAPITVEDKEFEFVTKIGKMEIRRKYKTKDMMYNGKFEW